MELLKERIREEGIVLNNRVLKVDGFLNHQIDPQLFKAIGKEIADRYRDAGVQRMKKSILMVDDVYHSVVYSYTKEENYDITISKKFLPAGEKVLIIDDFLASGEAAMGLAKLVQDAGDEVVGMAIAIEKSFQPGRERLENAGYRVESLVRIKEFKDNGCVFIED
ncbi:MAG: xanthine phosphoribosyltransferase [Veillonella sp.]|nr:xanthine phosphoribosyltransferase [Veillonella sp.]